MVYERPLRSDELMHFGVPGMKWGVRKKRENVNKFYSNARDARMARRRDRKMALGNAIINANKKAGNPLYKNVNSGGKSQTQPKKRRKLTYAQGVAISGAAAGLGLAAAGHYAAKKGNANAAKNLYAASLGASGASIAASTAHTAKLMRHAYKQTHRKKRR